MVRDSTAFRVWFFSSQPVSRRKLLGCFMDIRLTELYFRQRFVLWKAHASRGGVCRQVYKACGSVSQTYDNKHVGRLGWEGRAREESV